MSAKQSLAALQELLAEAAAKGADETALADGLRKRIASAEDWEQRATAFFASPNKHALQALEVRTKLRAFGSFIWLVIDRQKLVLCVLAVMPLPHRLIAAARCLL